MRTILLSVFFVASSFTLHAQYMGGSSDGDDVNTASDLLFTGSTATATSLLFLTHPGNTTVWKSDVSAIVDVVGSNNLQMGGSTSITISLANNPGSATVGGTATLSSSGGRATFTGLYLDKSGTGYTLEASATGLNSATGNAFNVAAASLAVSTQPPSNTYANQSFGLQVNVVDANGSILTLANPTLNLSIATNPGSATLSGTTSVQGSAGRVAFSGLSLNNEGSGYVLQIANPDMNSVNTNAFDVLSSSAFRGGNSDGDDVGTHTATLPVSGHIFWIGGLGSSPTDWNDALNWFPNTSVPGSSDRLAMEPNNNGHNPILDQDRTIYSMNFNGADKKLELGNHTLTLTADATGVNSSNYFKTNGSGKLKRPSIPNNEGFTFPVGNSAYNPITITNRTGTAEWFSVRVLDEIYEYGTFGNANTEPRVKRTWDIDKQTPNANAGNGVDFTFNWNANEVSSPAPQNYTLFHHDSNGNGWAEVVTGNRDPNFNPAANSMIWTGYLGSFSPFGVGDQNAPLPVDLLHFNAACGPGRLDFDWATASEINNRVFVVEQSADATLWQALAEQAGAGYSSSKRSYALSVPFEKVQGPYFRLYQEDYDGTREYFQGLHLECAGFAGGAWQLAPNPAGQQSYALGLEGDLDYRILDLQGRVARSGRLSAANGYRMDLNGLTPGMYQVHSARGVKALIKLRD